MPTIDQLSDRPQYPIKLVHSLTGVRPVTLRAWERRYKLLRPQRSAGNYRLYSEQDVAVLRWLKARVDNGLPISAAADELSQLRRTGAWPEAAPTTVARSDRAAPDAPPEAYQRRLFQALKVADEAAANAILTEAHAQFDLLTICTGLLTPCLVEIGEAWHRGEVRIATEHFASSFLRGRLMTLFQAFPTNAGAARVIVGCAPEERHDIGALMLALLLRRDGLRVEYLGADVYLDDLLDYIRVERPALVILSANAEAPARALTRLGPGLARLRPRPRFGFGGRAFNAHPELRAEVPGVFLGETLDEAVRGVHKLLQA